jgi:hypothetical protein
MATSSHAPSEALAYAKIFVKNARLDDPAIAYNILDEVHKEIWYRAPFSWTVAQGVTQTILAGTSDYVFANPPSFEYIYKAYLVDSNNICKALRIDSLLPTDSVKPGETISVSLSEGSPNATLRIFPKPPSTIPSTPQKIIWFYKKTAPEINISNYSIPGIHGLPDRWWHVYKAGVLAKAYIYADDDRGLQIKTNPKEKAVELGGYYAYFQYLLNEMVIKEPMPYVWDTRIEGLGDN